eukprot:NODE_1008_length_1159_cov_4.119820_g767_i0.p3 GENE.NODE_1008_length_1159_cov_4.119820_g767_i0~~NODE_1008_length_1159_cov_4.119820_g767_i0.p3  ORF type:complete len:148 (-),score=29.91 NODE_1008_length_1159_cov_4.119820_g767_i0:715-1098(-)
MATSRILSPLGTAPTSPPPGTTLVGGSTVFEWTGTLRGPEGTPYQRVASSPSGSPPPSATLSSPTLPSSARSSIQTSPQTAGWLAAWRGASSRTRGPVRPFRWAPSLHSTRCCCASAAATPPRAQHR